MLQDILKEFEERFWDSEHSCWVYLSDFESAKDFITHTYNTARKELVEEILSEMPKAYRTESYITEQPITQDEKSYGEGMNDFREIIINLLNKKI